MLIIDIFIRHDSQSEFYRQPFGAVPCGEQVVLRLKVMITDNVKRCWLRLWETRSEKETLLPLQPARSLETSFGHLAEDAPDTPSFLWYDVTLQAPEHPCLLYYFFILQTNDSHLYYGNHGDGLGGVGQLTNATPISWQITVYQPMVIPEWYKNGIMYQIFVDRFNRGLRPSFPLDKTRKNTFLHLNWDDIPYYIRDAQGRVTHWDFFGGNLQGIIDKLPYLQELGVSILYLNPIFEAFSNHKYDTGDYHKIDAMFGDEQIFEELVQTARSHGISIILDGVFSHTGDDSLYFNRYGLYPGTGAYQSPQSPYYSWYKFSPDGKSYKSWWNIDVLPEVNEMDPAYRQFIYGAPDSVLRHWLKKGIRGWRLDVADELPDEFIKELRVELKKSNANAVLIGEVWENATNKISYGRLREYFGGQELDSTMNYPFRDIFLHYLLEHQDAWQTHRSIMNLYETYPPENFHALMNLLGSHDRARVLTLLGEAPSEGGLSELERGSYKLSPERRDLALQRLRLFYLILMTFPGVPCIYYGDEAGLEGFSDPYNRGTYPWGKEDHSLLEWVKRLTRMRQEYEPLRSGSFQSFPLNKDIYGFTRGSKDDRIDLTDTSITEVHFQRNLVIGPEDGIPGPREATVSQDERLIILINSSRTAHHDVSIALKFDDLSGELPLVIDLLSGDIQRSSTLSRRLEPLSGHVILVKNPNQNKVTLPLRRSCGVLLHISSLPSTWGCGDLGDSAYAFVNLLKKSGQSLWQILPLNPTGECNSPYQSGSVFAGNPLFISLEHLSRAGLLEGALLKTGKVQDLRSEKTKLLRLAFGAFIGLTNKHSPIAGTSASLFDPEYLNPTHYKDFLQENATWLEDYVLFQALKKHFYETPWYTWDQEITTRKPQSLTDYRLKLAPEIEFQRFLQYTFFHQWKRLKSYANDQGIQIIGDMPLYVAADSCDVWVNPNLYKLDEVGRPFKVAGVPPDYFSERGQLWDNPLYDWNAMAITDYTWWKRRIRQTLRLFDFTRIDHFRGLEAYWEIDAQEKTAVNGRWLKGPGKRFFESLHAEFGKLPLIAEDLGLITPEVEILRQLFGFAGMKVLQFTQLEEFEAQLARTSDTNYIYYTGTHDNTTLLGWYKSLDRSTLREEHTAEEACRSLMAKLHLSPVAWVILPVQDVLCLDEDSRMNVPGTVGDNWRWQLSDQAFDHEAWEWLRLLTEKANR